jgi:hypothetical protein
MKDKKKETKRKRGNRSRSGGITKWKTAFLCMPSPFLYCSEKHRSAECSLVPNDTNLKRVCDCLWTSKGHHIIGWSYFVIWNKLECRFLVFHFQIFVLHSDSERPRKISCQPVDIRTRHLPQHCLSPYHSVSNLLRVRDLWPSQLWQWWLFCRMWPHIVW